MRSMLRIDVYGVGYGNGRISRTTPRQCRKSFDVKRQVNQLVGDSSGCPNHRKVVLVLTPQKGLGFALPSSLIVLPLIEPPAAC
jgi:hypothetical protein